MGNYSVSRNTLLMKPLLSARMTSYDVRRHNFNTNNALKKAFNNKTSSLKEPEKVVVSERR